MEALDDYVTFCRIVGPWTDWFQGPGGNLSVKSASRTHIFVKQSGVRIADTTHIHGWTLCDVDVLRECLNNCQEDFTSAVTFRSSESAKPSIEAVLHTLPPKYILHAHPAPLMTQLCTPNSTFELPTCKTKTVPYAKPGVPLANLIHSVYNPSVSVYFLRNHGILIVGDTLEEILLHMYSISIYLFPKGIHTDVLRVSEIAKQLHTKSLLLRPTGIVSPVETIYPYTPDIAVFFSQPIFCVKGDVLLLPSLTPQVISICNHLYIVGETLHQCSVLQELLTSYLQIDSTLSIPLSDSDVVMLRGWDKERDRLQKSK